jgi:hypothetical protein
MGFMGEVEGMGEDEGRRCMMEGGWGGGVLVGCYRGVVTALLVGKVGWSSGLDYVGRCNDESR